MQAYTLYRLGAPIIVHCLSIRGLFTIISAQCTYCAVYLSGDYSPLPDHAVARVSITYVLSRTSLRQQGISHLSLQQVTRVHPLSLVARVFRCAAARYGCACTAAALDNRSGTAPGLGCGEDTSGRRFCSARPAWSAAWRSCALRAAPLQAGDVAVAVSGFSLLGALLLAGRLACVCSLRWAWESP